VTDIIIQFETFPTIVFSIKSLDPWHTKQETSSVFFAYHKSDKYFVAISSEAIVMEETYLHKLSFKTITS
jgi:hypothetical protein